VLGRRIDDARSSRDNLRQPVNSAGGDSLVALFLLLLFIRGEQLLELLHEDIVVAVKPRVNLRQPLVLGEELLVSRLELVVIRGIASLLMSGNLFIVMSHVIFMGANVISMLFQHGFVFQNAGLQLGQHGQRPQMFDAPPAVFGLPGIMFGVRRHVFFLHRRVSVVIGLR
jgi:hypothetical protein